MTIAILLELSISFLVAQWHIDTFYFLSKVLSLGWWSPYCVSLSDHRLNSWSF